MSKKYDQAFFDIYYSVDKRCCKKFGIEKDGVSEYLTRLENARFAPHREEVLSILTKCKNLNSGSSLKDGDAKKYAGILKSAIKWLKKFDKKLKGKKDPLSLYLKKARRYKRRKNFGRFLTVLFFLAVDAAAVCGILQLHWILELI